MRGDALVGADVEDVAADAADVELRLATGFAVDERGIGGRDGTDVIDVQFFDRIARDGRDGDRGVLQITGALLRGDDDLFEQCGLGVGNAGGDLREQDSGDGAIDGDGHDQDLRPVEGSRGIYGAAVRLSHVSRLCRDA